MAFMKSNLLWLPLSLAVVLLASCSETEDPGPLQEIERQYSVANFDRIDMGNAFDVTVEKGTYFEVRVRGDRRNVDDLSVRKVGSTLVIDFDEYRTRRHQTFIYITMPELDFASLSGATTSRISGFYEVESLGLNLSGASICQLNADVSLLEVVLSGSSQLNAVGEGDIIRANVSGASLLRCFNFPVTSGDIQVTGASNASVFVSTELKATASGASVVRYRGSPTVTAQVSDGSVVRQD